jgi:alpha-1,6-mannosyltransferase
MLKLRNQPKKTLGWILILVSLVIGTVIAICILVRGVEVKKLILFLPVLATLFKGIDLVIISRNISESQKNDVSISKKLLPILGSINLISLLLYSWLSHGLASVIPGGNVTPNKKSFYAELVRKIYPGYQVPSSGQNFFEQKEIWLGIYCGLMLLFTVIFVVTWLILAVKKDNLDVEIPKKIFYWSIAFALVCILASPVLYVDFWYPVVWGRMILVGANPYYTALNVNPGFLQGLPLGPTKETMMYGPLWAVINGVIVGISGGSSLLSGFLFKVILAGAWIGSLKIIWLLLWQQTIWLQAFGLLFFGWLPISLIQAVADGHNDIFMVFFILLWLYLLKQGKFLLAILFLTASVLIKYVSAPLFFLHFFYLFFWLKQRNWSVYLLQGVAALTFALIMIGVFCRSLSFFDYFRSTQEWYFLTIRDGLRALEWMYFGRMDRILGLSTRIVFVLIAIYYVFRFCRQPNWKVFYLATLASFCMVLFGIASHVWPWYLIWVIGLAALVPKSNLAIWVFGISLLMPFSVVIWVLFPKIDPFYIFHLPALLIYLIASLWFIVIPRRWFPEYQPENPSIEWKSNSVLNYQ